MSGVSYGNRGGRIRVTAVRGKTGAARPVEDVVREIKRHGHPVKRIIVNGRLPSTD